MKKAVAGVWLSFFIVSLGGGSQHLSAYDVETHSAIAEQAVAAPSLDRILKDDLV